MRPKPALSLATHARAHPVEGQVMYLQTEAGPRPFIVRMVTRGRNAGYRLSLETLPAEQVTELERLYAEHGEKRQQMEADALRAMTPWILGQQLSAVAGMLLALPRWRRVAVRWGMG